MKKKIYILLTLLLAACLLFSGCAAADTLRNAGEGLFSGAHTDMVSFDRMEYTRPDMDELRGAVDAAAEKAGENAGEKELIELLDVCYDLYDSFDTMYTLSDIRSCQDTGDEFYAAEYQWCDENYSVVLQLFDGLYYACAACSCAAELERDYLWEGFCEEYSDSGSTYYDDEYMALLAQESALLTQYRQLSANPTIAVNGGDVDYYDYIYWLDDDAYYAAQEQYYQQHNGEFADIYIQLVKTRSAMAELCGYDSYEQMQYDSGFMRDYSPDDAAHYVEDIKEYIVPLYASAVEAGCFDDISYDYLSEKRLVSLMRSLAQGLGGGIEEAFDFMEEYGLYDASVSSGKLSLSFQSYLVDYDAPFLFLDAYGDVEDILSFSHEFGHYADAYVNYNYTVTTDLAECQSQAMEYLALCGLRDVLSDSELENLTDIKLMDTLDLYVQQASFAEFERQVYALPESELSAEKLNELSLQAAIDFGYYDGVSEIYYAMSWCDISHFFQTPFYIISYPVSNDIAMQIYALELRQDGAGAEKYMKLIDRDFTQLMEAVEACGFESPFADGRMEDTADLLSALLGLGEKL